MVIFGSALIIWQLIWAVRNYRQVRKIPKDGKTFKVFRNNKVLFEGHSMDLASVRTDFGNYFLDSLNRRIIKVPNDAFLDPDQIKGQRYLHSLNSFYGSQFRS